MPRINAYKIQRNLRRSQRLVLSAADSLEKAAQKAADRMRASVEPNEDTSELLAKLILGKRTKAETRRLGFCLREAASAYFRAWQKLNDSIVAPGSRSNVGDARKRMEESQERLYHAARTFTLGSYDRND